MGETPFYNLRYDIEVKGGNFKGLKPEIHHKQVVPVFVAGNIET